jgi:hypothetical protein
MNESLKTKYIAEEIGEGHCVHSDRQSGKTTALMQHIHGRHAGDAIVITINWSLSRMFEGYYRETYPKDHVPHVFGAEGAASAICGSLDAVYCDEWFLFPPKVQKFLRDSGRVKGAVGTLPPVAKVPL